MRVAIVAFSPVARDGRVLRTVRALARQGHEVHLIGYGASPSYCPAHFYSLGPPPTRMRHWAWVLVGYAPAILSPHLTRLVAPLRPLHRHCCKLLREIHPDVIHANDWPVLAIAVMIKKATGAHVVYDSHEFAREEHAEQWLWRLLYRPHICATETAGLREADRVVTIGPGIARLIADAYQLTRAPDVILNVPGHQAVRAHAIKQRLELLYHGLMTAGRGIETLIMAAAQVKRPIRLILRGDGKNSYVNDLRRLAASCASPGQIVFEPAVPFDQVIEAAACADIGLFTPPLITPQARFMLPNKLFEYLMAGLMVIFPDGDDVAKIIGRYGCGLVLSDISPSGLAAVIDRLEVGEIQRRKNQALESARSLCWEREQSKLIALYDELDKGVAASGRTRVLTV